MRLKLGVIAFGCFLLLLIGMQPDGVPFFRDSGRYSDSVTAHWPNALYLRQSAIENRTLPLWRETLMAGQPFAANPLNKTAYPFQWLVLVFQPALHLNVMILLHLFLAGAGMWIWANSLNLRVEAIVFSTIAYTFAPRVFGHLGAGHLDVIYAMAWFPWLMWSIRQLIRSPIALKTVVQASLVVAFIVLADVRVSLYALLTSLVYTWTELWQTRAWKTITPMVSVSLIALVLIAGLIVPLVLWATYVTRADLSVSDAGVLSLEPIQLIGLILASRPPAIETLTYFGLPVLLLAGVAFSQVRRRTQAMILVVGAIIALFAIGSNGFLWPTLIQIIPGLRWFRVPSRIWLIPALLIPLLAGYGLQWVLGYIEGRRSGKRSPVRSRVNLIIACCMAVVVICGLFATVALPMPQSVGITAFIMGVGLSICLFGGLSGRITSHLVSTGIIVLTLIDLGVTAYSWTEWRGKEQWLDPQRLLAERLLEAQPGRIYSPTYSLEQQVAEIYELRLFGGVDPFQLRGVVNAIQQGSGIQYTSYSVVQPPLVGTIGDELSQANREAVIDTRVLAEWDVSHVIAAYPIVHSHLELIDTVSDVYIYSNLDYEASPETHITPDWPSGWAGLPDVQTVERLNQITFVSWLISMIGFAICIGLLIFIILRQKRG